MVSAGRDGGGQPAGGAQETRIAVSRADELDAERQAVRPRRRRDQLDLLDTVAHVLDELRERRKTPPGG